METFSQVKKTHTVEKVYKIGGREFRGKFTFKLLTIKDRVKVNSRTKQLIKEAGLENIDISLDDLSKIIEKAKLDMDYMNYVILNSVALLEVAIVEKPDWFNLDEIYDLNILLDLVNEYMNFENFFLVGNTEQGQRQSSSGADTDSREITQN